MWWDGDSAFTVVSFLYCSELLRLTTSNRYVLALRLEQGLVALRVRNLSTARLCQHFVDWARRCKLLLDLDMSHPCQPTDAVVQGIVWLYRHLLVIDLKDTRLVTDQAVHAVAQRCPSLIKISLGACSVAHFISNEAVKSIAHHCSQLVCIDLNDTALTDDGAQAFACSCKRLWYASVGRTWVTEVGARVLAERCTVAKERAKRVSSQGQGPWGACPCVDSVNGVAPGEPLEPSASDYYIMNLHRGWRSPPSETTAIDIEWPLHNLSLHRLGLEFYLPYLEMYFPSIDIFA